MNLLVLVLVLALALALALVLVLVQALVGRALSILTRIAYSESTNQHRLSFYLSSTRVYTTDINQYL